MKYEDITFQMLGTKRQRPLYVSAFTECRNNMDMKTYPKDPHQYTKYFLTKIDSWIKQHQKVLYINLDSFKRRDVILGVSQQLDELHLLHGKNIVVFKGEYKYHRRLTNHNVKQITDFKQLKMGDVLIISYPSCITTGSIDNIDQLLNWCLTNKVDIHVDGAWFGQCRNFKCDVSHPAIKSVSVSLSKAYGMGSQRIGIRYSRENTTGPISIMNDYNYVNVSDMWIGCNMIDHFGPDYLWKTYGEIYSKVCKDFQLEESNSIHVGFNCDDNQKIQIGVRTPMRMLIDNMFDVRGTDKGLNEIEKNER